MRTTQQQQQQPQPMKKSQMTTTITTIIIWGGSIFYYVSVIFLVILWLGDNNNNNINKSILSSLFTTTTTSTTTILGVQSFSIPHLPSRKQQPSSILSRSPLIVSILQQHQQPRGGVGGADTVTRTNHPLSSKRMMTLQDTTDNSSPSSLSSSSSTPLRVIKGIREIVDDYDIFLLDMWGVMHDGISPYPDVLNVIQQLQQTTTTTSSQKKKKKKELVILSNSSKRLKNSHTMLTKLGFQYNDFSKIITSGEVSYQLLLSASTSISSTSTTWNNNNDNVIPSLTPKPWPLFNDILTTRSTATTTTTTTTTQSQEGLVGQEQSSSSTTTKRPLKVFCFGSGDDDDEYLTSCGWMVSSTIQDSSLLVARGTFTIRNNDGTILHKLKHGEELYFQRLQEALQLEAQNQIPMIVTNPDKIRPDSDRSPMPGTIGDEYERILTKYYEEENGDSVKEGEQPKTNMANRQKAEELVKRIGKPFPDVYEIALRRQEEEEEETSKLQQQPVTETTASSPPLRVCMVGDALETDVTGGTLEGLDTIWVIQDGIHNDAVEERRQRIKRMRKDMDDDLSDDDLDDDSSLAASCAAVLDEFNQQTETTYAKGRQLRPTMIMRRFCW